MGDKPSLDDPISDRGEPTLSHVAEALLLSSTDGVLIVGLDGVIRECNLAAEQMFGYTREGLLGIRIEQLLPERLRKGHDGHRAEFHEHATPRMMGARQDLYALRSDGREFSVAISLIP